MRSISAVFLAVVLFLLAVFALADDQIPVTPPDIPTIESCGIDTDLFILDSITLTPDPPQRGQNLRVVVKGQVKDTVADGKVDVKVKLGKYITILNKQYQLCELAGEFEETCPISDGTKEWVKDIELPAVIPPGRFTADVKITTGEESPRNVACFVANLVF
jgi:hypothetical protein